MLRPAQTDRLRRARAICQRSARLLGVLGWTASAAIGLGLHFFIACGAATTYFVGAVSSPRLQRPMLCAPLFGLAVGAFMRHVVLGASIERVRLSHPAPRTAWLNGCVMNRVRFSGGPLQRSQVIPSHPRTRKLPHRILSHPFRRRILRVRQSSRDSHGRAMECTIAFADCAQGHVHGLLDEMSFVAGFVFDGARP